ncbi:hypothetical protein E0K89_022040 [Aquicoccus sp. SCR17]|nr:hypothetical protein [Carideicomes alvinocaridis]
MVAVNGVTPGTLGSYDPYPTLEFTTEGDIAVNVTVQANDDGTLSFTLSSLDDNTDLSDIDGLFLETNDPGKLSALHAYGDNVTAQGATPDAYSELPDGTEAGGSYDMFVEFGTGGEGSGHAGTLNEVKFTLYTDNEEPLSLADFKDVDFSLLVNTEGTPDEPEDPDAPCEEDPDPEPETPEECEEDKEPEECDDGRGKDHDRWGKHDRDDRHGKDHDRWDKDDRDDRHGRDHDRWSKDDRDDRHGRDHDRWGKDDRDDRHGKDHDRWGKDERDDRHGRDHDRWGKDDRQDRDDDCRDDREDHAGKDHSDRDDRGDGHKLFDLKDLLGQVRGGRTDQWNGGHDDRQEEDDPAGHDEGKSGWAWDDKDPLRCFEDLMVKDKEQEDRWEDEQDDKSDEWHDREEEACADKDGWFSAFF